MQMLKKRHFFLIFAFLSIGSSLWGREGDIISQVSSSDVHPGLAAALCEMAAWERSDRIERDSLLIAKAAYLEAAGRSERAYETLNGIPRAGLPESLSLELQRLRIITAWSSGHIDDLRVLLSETDLTKIQSSAGVADAAPDVDQAGVFDQGVDIAEPRAKSEDLAMFLSIIPGCGSAYACDWPNAGKYFLINGGIIVLGVAAFTGGLPITAILGGGMLLSRFLPESTAIAIDGVTRWNTHRALDAYTPYIHSLR